LGKFLEVLGLESVGTFYVHLEYSTAVWYILGPFCNLVVIWYIFPSFGTLYQEKSGDPGSGSGKEQQVAIFHLSTAATQKKPSETSLRGPRMAVSFLVPSGQNPGKDQRSGRFDEFKFRP
jgi:hypothetical protein